MMIPVPFVISMIDMVRFHPRRKQEGRRVELFYFDRIAMVGCSVALFVSPRSLGVGGVWGEAGVGSCSVWVGYSSHSV